MQKVSVKKFNNTETLDEFWFRFNPYIDELAKHASDDDDFDLDYFYSDDYRLAVKEIMNREKNPIRIYDVLVDGELAGFMMYQLDFREVKTAFLMEFSIEKRLRSKGIGQKAYLLMEREMINEGAHRIDLTPTNDRNQGFWKRMGFIVTDEVDEDDCVIYRKNDLGEDRLRK